MPARYPAVLVVVVALLTAGCVPGTLVFAQSCAVEASRGAVVDAAGLTLVQVRAGAGSLRIEGQPGLTEVRIDGTACAPSQQALAAVDLTATRSGSTLLIEAPDRDIRRGSLSLTITMPAALPISVEDGSGATEIAGVAAAAVADGSGSLRVERVAGDVRLRDGSGSLDVREIGGSVVVEGDGSGGIVIRDVARDVTIEADGSGGIIVSDVGGDLVVGSDGSGRVRWERVAGRVSVPRD